MIYFVIYCVIISGVLCASSAYICNKAIDTDERYFAMLFGTYATLCGILFAWASVLLFLQIKAAL